jgi:ankyrin repeat protein
LPETLDETYERTLREINKADSELAHRLFQCVAVAYRPLRVEELAEFLAFDFSAGPIPKFREDWRLEDPVEAVLSTCSTLFSLVDVDGSQVIQFSHFSVKEFLTSSRFVEKCDTISRCYHVCMTPAHTLVAQACLGILLHLDKNVTRDGLWKFPLSEYAAKHWVEHARFEGVSENAEEGMKQLFDGSKPHLTVWLWIYDPIRRPYKRKERPSPPRRTPLHYAAFCGLHTVVKFMAIGHLEHVHSQDVDDESTPLHLASREGHVEVAQFLVKHGARATARDKYGSTPLHQLSQSGNGNVDLARLLVEHGADVTAQDEYGSTPLHRLSRLGSGNVNFAQFLVEHGADVTTQDKDGSTPIHLLSRSVSGNVDFAQFLVEHGADVTAQDKDGMTPLHQLSRSGSRNLDLARFLIEHGADATAQDKDESTPLHHLSQAYGANVGLARILVEHGADATALDSEGSTPLHELSRSHWGNLHLAQFLIEHGADATIRDKHGSTPLHQLSRSVSGNVNLARFLIEHGADATARDEYGSTPLHYALICDRMDLARFLVEHGADTTAQDKDGLTPLHRLSRSFNENVDFARFLIEHGADATARDKDGSTPLHQAVIRGHEDLARFLVEHGANMTTQATSQIQQPTMT